jgi:hypothetical protein
MIENKYSEEFFEKFEKLFPKGKDKRRGDALIIQALAYLEGRENAINVILDKMKELEKTEEFQCDVYSHWYKLKEFLEEKHEAKD